MTPINCPRCGYDQFKKGGSILAARGRVQRFVCLKCRKKFHLSLVTQPIAQVEGFLDIEASQLVASFGHVISWAIKKRKGKITSDILTARSLDEERRVLASLLEELKRYDLLYTYYGCVTPGHRVLTNDLRWVPVESLQPGDTLLAFDEEAPRTWKTSVVVHAPLQIAEVYRITLSDGTTLEATGDHPWLVGTESRWVRTDHMNRFSKGTATPIRRLMPVWESVGDSWVAGFTDGEGSLRNGNDEITIAQVPSSPALARLEAELDRYGFSHSSVLVDAPGRSPIVHVRIAGGFPQRARFIGMFRPERFLSTFTPPERHLQFEQGAPILRVENIESVGRKEIVALGTTTQTYIVEGFGSHNTGFDIPFIRTRCLYHGLEFPEYMSLFHRDVYYMARGRLSLHSKRLAVVAEFLGIKGKTRVDPAIWVAADMGNAEEMGRALAYILKHNREDVRVLEKVYDRLEPFVKPTNRSV